MTPSALAALLKEVLFDKNELAAHFKRNKLVWLLLICHLIFFGYLLFLSEQTVQKESQLIEMRRDALLTKGSVEKLAACELDREVALNQSLDAKTQLEYVSSDYRELQRAQPNCPNAEPAKVAPIPTPIEKRPVRPQKHPPRRLERSSDVDYQHVLEGL